MTDANRIVILKPGDILHIGNVGTLDADTLDSLPDTLSPLAKALGLATVTVFEHDIQATASEPATPQPDAVVLRVFDREAVTRHRAELASWLQANGLDHTMVAADWLTIEQAGDLRFIRYLAFRMSANGHKVVDPRDAHRAWTVERVAPLVVDLDLPGAANMTEGDRPQGRDGQP